MTLFFPELNVRLAVYDTGHVHSADAVGDCILLAYASELQATLVTFDRQLHAFARKYDYSAVLPA